MFYYYKVKSNGYIKEFKLQHWTELVEFVGIMYENYPIELTLQNRTKKVYLYLNEDQRFGKVNNFINKIIKKNHDYLFGDLTGNVIIKSRWRLNLRI